MKKREALAKMLSNYYRFDRRAWVLFGCFSLGFLLGILMIRLGVSGVSDPAGESAYQLLFGFGNMSFSAVFVQYFLQMSISYLFVILLGLFVPGEVLSLAYMAAVGLRIGAILGVIYRAYRMQGILFSFSVLLVPLIIFVMALIFAFRETVGFSLSLLRQFLGKRCDNLLADYKAFVIRSLLFPAGILLSAGCGALLQRCFAVLFSF